MNQGRLIFTQLMEVYADLAQVLIRKARRLYHNDSTELNLDEIVYALDSTTIDLCLSMFPWARFRQTKGAVKMHTQIDLRGSIPVFISITDGKAHDVHFLDQIIIEPGSIYVMDRAYVDFVRLHRIHCGWAFFVTRAKKNMRFYVVESRPVDRSTGVRCDQTIRLNGPKSKHLYPDKLRRIRFIDPESGATLVFLSNNFKLPPLVIAAIYKSRWYIELFFKWIKQNLRIKAFHGTSENAVKTQIWIAICVYLLVACLKKVHRIDQSLSRILQVISVNVFQKDPLHQLLTEFATSNPDVRTSIGVFFSINQSRDQLSIWRNTISLHEHILETPVIHEKPELRILILSRYIYFLTKNGFHLEALKLFDELEQLTELDNFMLYLKARNFLWMNQKTQALLYLNRVYSTSGEDSIKALIDQLEFPNEDADW